MAPHVLLSRLTLLTRVCVSCTDSGEVATLGSSFEELDSSEADLKDTHIPMIECKVKVLGAYHIFLNDTS